MDFSPPALFEVTLTLCEDLHTGGDAAPSLTFPCLIGCATVKKNDCNETHSFKNRE
jgi:hypothetical protein